MKLARKTLHTYVTANSSHPFCRFILSPDFVPDTVLGIGTEQGHKSLPSWNVLHFNEKRQAKKQAKYMGQ